MTERPIDAVIASKRALIDRLDAFTHTPEFERLLVDARDSAGDGTEAWLAEWLIQPAFGLGDRPIDIAAEPGGMDRLADQLTRIRHGSGA
ncbi:antitoxin Xre/MbcA/ParS toxin-binding domain-containing protein [Roseateles sp. P5_E11]